MKLKEYFDDIKKNQISEYQKMQVYEQFLRDSDKVSLYKKISFYWKI
jgi:hypothetical protein